jgi:hypothetical protein
MRANAVHLAPREKRPWFAMTPILFIYEMNYLKFSKIRISNLGEQR